MKPHITALERAFELARSGRYPTSTDIKKTLAREGYGLEQVSGATLMRQLRAVIEEARKE